MLWAIAVSMKLKLITMKKTDFGFSGEKPVLCLQPRRGAAGTSRPGGNFPFASHTSSLGSCSISEKPGTAGLWDDSCSCVTISLHLRTPVLPAIAAGGGEETFKAHARANSPSDAPKFPKFPMLDQ